MGLFDPPNIKKLKAKRNVKGLIKALGFKKDYSVRTDAAIALGELGDARAVEPLIAAVNGADILVHWGAATALGQIGDPRAVAPLFAALNDRDYGEHEAAAGALEKLGWRPGQDEAGAVFWISKGEWGKCIEIGPPAVEPLITILKRFDWSRYSQKVPTVIAALGQIGDRRAVEPLIGLLGNGALCQAAASALVQMGDPRAVEPLIHILKGSLNQRQAAAGALAQMGDTRAIEPLIGVLKDYGYRFREAADVLDQLGWQPGQDEAGAAYWIIKGEWEKCIKIGKPAVALLVEALKEGESDTRQAAARALIKIGEPAVRPLLSTLAASDHYDVRQPAAEIIAKIGEPAIGPLIAAIKAGPFTTRRVAAGALEQRGPYAIKALIAALTEDNQYIHEAVSDALLKIGQPAIEPLVAALLEGVFIVRWQAARTLERLGWRPRQDEAGAAYWIVKGEFEKCIEIGAPAVKPFSVRLAELGYSVAESSIASEAKQKKDKRKRIVTALGQIGDPSALPALQKSLEKDESDGVRCRAQRSIEWIQQKNAA